MIVESMNDDDDYDNYTNVDNHLVAFVVSIVRQYTALKFQAQPSTYVKLPTEINVQIKRVRA